MGSPITFSGFNNIDFGSILNTIMTAERHSVDCARDAENRRSISRAQRSRRWRASWVRSHRRSKRCQTPTVRHLRGHQRQP